MPNFKSVEGIWYPQDEKAVNIHSGDIYQGPDREAIRMIAKELGVKETEVSKENYLPSSTHVKDDPQIIELARQRGYKTTEEYLEANKPTEQQKKIQKIAQEKIIDHKNPEPKERQEPTLGGFSDTIDPGYLGNEVSRKIRKSKGGE